MQNLITEALYLILILSAPMLLAAIGTGLLISIFQATTQIQEQTLSFVPKIIATFVAVIWAGPRIATELEQFMVKVFGDISQMGPG
ncbi:MAG: flagellar biosynthesis protein FliQ [Armatimonadetes bacterium]|nr:flagellar biosynthesis protein FliQ [Armatimonadota bacterium]